MVHSLVRAKSFEFALEIIGLYKQLRETREFVISNQVLRSGTSLGANVEEARESEYWPRLLQESEIAAIDVSRQLTQAGELIRMLTSTIKTTSESHNNSKLIIQNSPKGAE